MTSAYIPNTAAIPNIIFDHWMAILTPAEFKVLMAIARKTYGWQKQKDRISLRQLVELTGLNKSSVVKAIENLIQHDLVSKIKCKGEYGDEPNLYEINLDIEKKKQGSSFKRHPPVVLNDTPRVVLNDTQNPLLTKPTITKYKASELAHGLAVFFLDELRKINPKIQKPINLDAWAKQFDLMLNRDKHSQEDIQKMISYLISTKNKPSGNGFSWANVILCAASFREKFPRLWAEATSLVCANEKLPEKNKELASSVEKKFKNRSDIVVGPDYLEFINGHSCKHLKFTDKNFIEETSSQLKIRNLKI